MSEKFLTENDLNALSKENRNDKKYYKRFLNFFGKQQNKTAPPDSVSHPAVCSGLRVNYIIIICFRIKKYVKLRTRSRLTF